MYKINVHDQPQRFVVATNDLPGLHLSHLLFTVSTIPQCLKKALCKKDMPLLPPLPLEDPLPIATHPEP